MIRKFSMVHKRYKHTIFIRFEVKHFNFINMNPDQFLKNNSKNYMNPDHFPKTNTKNDLKIFSSKKKKNRHFFPPSYKYESISFPKNNSKNDMNPDYFLNTNSKSDLKFSMIHKHIIRYVLSKLEYHFQKNNSENDMT